MKRIVLLGLAFLIIPLFNCSVCANVGSGVIVINATITGAWRLNLSLHYPEIIIPEDYYFFENLTVFQGDSQNISVYLNKTDPNGFVKFVNQTGGGTYYQDDYTMVLSPYQYKDVTIRIYVPPGMGYNGGTYNVQIYADSLSDYRSNSTTLEVNVNNTNPIDDIQILNLYPTSLYQGESINADISIHKIYPAETTDVQICYCINANPTYQCGPAYNNYGCEWKAITSWLNYTKTVTVSDSPGEFYFFAAVKYPGEDTIKRAISPKFLVKKVPGPPSAPGGVAPISVAQPELAVISPDYLEAAPGETIRLNVGAENTGNADALNTSLSVYGIPENWLSITPYAQDIGKGETKNYSVSVSLPLTANEQVYSLSLVAKSGEEEGVKVVTLTVAMTPSKQAQFLLEEARSKKGEAEGITEDARNLGMDVTEPERGIESADILLGETERLFGSGDYERSADKAKEAIDAYKSVISLVNGIVNQAFSSLIGIVRADLESMEKLTGETDVIESVREKIEQGAILQREGRMIGAYETLLEAKRLLDQLKGKVFFMELTQNTVIIAILAVIIVSSLMVVFYKKRMSRFLKSMRIEEHKKSLRSLFKKEIRPSAPRKERRIGRENVEELRRLLGIGEALTGTDISGAKEAYDKAKKIYGSLSSEEKRMVSEEIIRLAKLHNTIIRRSR